MQTTWYANKMEFSLVSCILQLLDKLYLYLHTQTFHVCQIGSLSPRVWSSDCCMNTCDHNKLRLPIMRVLLMRLSQLIPYLLICWECRKDIFLQATKIMIINYWLITSRISCNWFNNCRIYRFVLILSFTYGTIIISVI